MSDRDDIIDVAIRYTWALDTRRFDDLDDVFTPDASATLHGVDCADRDAIVARIRGAVERFDRTQHLVGNHQVAVDGDTATHRCQLQGQHVKDDADGGDTFIIGGFYEDRLVRTDAGWRISHRLMEGTWTSGNRNILSGG